ncbi:metal-sulfur cluster assembly factor [Limosilactobacillus caccae]|jgi:metal-sulfur cluster biosynthetic enzyme|uniref:metal-sulfur cluster assembly factor n=1 Tax=Limosilactobacillus caccae TaxID=1926284 RepID=UPI0009704156|nr:metal-sulfur cluster assembly factor [Limosilactobacillus caccae]
MAQEQEKPFSPIENKVMDALEEVIDPELGIDLVNLGLIYDVTVDDQGQCTVTMTLTTMGCPLGDFLNEAITKAVTSVDGIEKCDINLVWEPVWDISRMSRFAKVALGIHG